MYITHPTPSSLAEVLLARFPDAQVEAEQYVRLTCSTVNINVWVSDRSDLLRIRSVLVRRGELGQLTEQQRHELTASLNATFLFGRFNAESSIGLLHDYELPYISSISLDLVAQAIGLVSLQSIQARQHFDRALKRAQKI